MSSISIQTSSDGDRLTSSDGSNDGSISISPGPVDVIKSIISVSNSAGIVSLSPGIMLPPLREDGGNVNVGAWVGGDSRASIDSGTDVGIWGVGI